MRYSACKLNKQGDNIQPLHTPFPIWNQSVVPCPILTVASWPEYRFLRRLEGGLVFPSFEFSVCCDPHSKGFSVVNEAEVDVFLEFLCFLYDPTNVGNLIAGSSAFSKSSLYIWKFLIHVLLKPSLKDFEHNLASMGNEHKCLVVWIFFCTALLWDWNENWPFPVLWPLLSFFFHIECSTLTLSFRIWNHMVTLFLVF